MGAGAGKGAPAPGSDGSPTEAAVRYVLGLLGTGRPDLPPAPAVRDRALTLVRFHRLEGLAVARHREARPPPAGDLPPGLEAAYRRTALATTLTLEAVARARTALDGAAIASLTFKGAALVAAGHYADPGARRMDDADLLVGPDQVEGAVGVLRDAGFQPWSPWSPDRTRWLDSATFHDSLAPAGLPVALDLHWRTEYGGLRFGGRRAASGLKGRRGGGSAAGEGPTGSLLWEGADLTTGLPAPETHLVVVAEHLAKHLRYRVHLEGWADLVRLSAAVADWDRVARSARGRPLSRATARLLEAARLELGAPVPPGWAASVTRPQSSARATARPAGALLPSRQVGRVTPAGSRLGGLLLRWRLLGSPVSVARDLRHAAVPGTAWLRARYGGGSALGLQLRYWADVVGWLRGRTPSPASPNQGPLHRRAPARDQESGSATEGAPPRRRWEPDP